MIFSSWLRNRTTIPRANRAAALRQRPARFRPALEMLEDRCVPSTLTVKNYSTIINNTAPAGSGPDVYNLGTLSVDGSSTIGIVNT